MNARLATVAVERAALEQAVATLSLRLQRVVDHIAKLTVQPPAATTHREGPSAARRTASASACPSSNSASLTPARFIDIGVNLTDPMFRGEYRGKPKHRDDLDDVLGRGWATGLDAVFITGGSLSESAAALKLCELDNRLFCTVGCHPTRCTEYKDGGAAYGAALERLIQTNRGRVVAVGECGLDYARLQFCDKATQLEFFEKQLELAARVQLPLFLHCRDAGDDFCEVMRRHRPHVVGGVVHSFDGSAALAAELVAMGLSIGINGCSLKTQENLDVAASIPRSALMIETDAPWCDIRPTHAGHKHVRTLLPVTKAEKFETGKGVKSRNEPALIRQVLEILAAVRNDPELELAAAIVHNTNALFFSPTQTKVAK